jgi:hypothetical protein
MDIFELILAIAGGISIIGSAGVFIAKLISPAYKLNERVKKLEEQDKNGLDVIEEIKNTNRLLCEGILCILENTITGNSVENLKAVKLKIQDFLIRK